MVNYFYKRCFPRRSFHDIAFIYSHWMAKKLIKQEERPWVIKWSLLLFVLTIVVQVACSKGWLQEEKTALLDFKAFLEFNNASGKPLLPSWISDPKSDCCGWERVTCDPYSNYVMQLSLENVYHDPREVSDSYSCHSFISLNFSFFLPFKRLRNMRLSSNCFNESIMAEGTFQTCICFFFFL